MSRKPWGVPIRAAIRAASAAALALTMVLLCIPSTPAVAAVATGPVTTTATYNVDFETSGQNMWGSGANAAPSSATIPIIPTQTWGPTSGSANNIVTSGSFDTNLDYDSTVCALDTDGDCGNQNDFGCLGSLCGDSNLDIDGFSLDTDGDSGGNNTDTSAAQFGGNIQGSTSGSIGASLNVSGLSGGTVAVNYPIQVSETITQPGQYLKPGDQVTITSHWTLQPGYAIATRSAQGTVGMSGTFAFSASASGTVCVVSCGSFNIFPSVNIPSTSGTIVTSFGPTSPIPVLGSGLSGQIGAPQFGVTSTVVGPNGTSLVATGADTFWNLRMDLAKIMDQVTGVSVLAGATTISGVGFHYSLLQAVASPNVQATQTLTFAPTVLETLTFPVPVAYTAYASGGRVYGSGTATQVVFPADGSVQITVPNVPSGPLPFVPSFSLAHNTLANRSGFTLNWSLGLTALTASATFAQAGSLSLGPVEQYQTPPTSVSFPVTGSGSLFGLDTSSWQLAGFNGATESTDQLLVDSLPPTTTASVAGTPGNNGWWKAGSPVTLTLHATDNLSGVAATYYQITDHTTGTTGPWQTYTTPVGFPDGVYTVSYYSVDRAGNQESPQSIGIKVDQTPPSITLASRQPAANAYGWNNGPVTVTWECADALSGPVSPTVTETLSGQGAGQTAQGTCADLAGNTTSASLDGINIELLPPTLAYTGDLGTYTVDQTVAIACNLTPSLAPILTDTCTPIQGPAYAFALGTHTYTSSVSDEAGYSADATTTFTVAVTSSSLCHLTAMFESKPVLVRSFCAKLDNAAALVGRGNGHASRNMIAAYEDEVAAQRGKSLTVAHAQVLTSLAQALAAQNP